MTPHSLHLIPETPQIKDIDTDMFVSTLNTVNSSEKDAFSKNSRQVI